MCVSVDVSQANRGNASFRAFRLSKEFLNAHRKPPFSAKSWVVCFISQALASDLIHPSA
jgi:hypothetical protein